MNCPLPKSGCGPKQSGSGPPEVRRRHARKQMHTNGQKRRLEACGSNVVVVILQEPHCSVQAHVSHAMLFCMSILSDNPVSFRRQPGFNVLGATPSKEGGLHPVSVSLKHTHRPLFPSRQTLKKDQLETSVFFKNQERIFSFFRRIHLRVFHRFASKMRYPQGRATP